MCAFFLPDSAEDASPHVRIRIAPEKKLEWLEYADEHDLSHRFDQRRRR